MTEILSENEIESLLTSISCNATVANDSIHDNQTKVKLYNFARPDKFSMEHIRTLCMIHETFSRMTTTSLSALLRIPVSVHVASVDQLTYEEFIRPLPCPSTLSVIKMVPLGGYAVLEIDPSLSFVIIDLLLGGKGNPVELSREMSDLELSLMEGVIVSIIGLLRECWLNVTDLRPCLESIETNPNFAQIVPATEMTILVSFEVRIGDVEGVFNLALPYHTMESIRPALTQDYLYNSVVAEPSHCLQQYPIDSKFIKRVKFDFSSKLNIWDNLVKINKKRSIAIDSLISQRLVYSAIPQERSQI